MAQRKSDPLSRGLGVLSAGLAAPPLLAPTRLAQALAVGKGTKQRAVLLAVGARELVAAAGLIARPSPAFLWARVGGDTMDLAMLGRALRNHDRRGIARTIGATAVVAGITGLDVYAALTRSAKGGAAREVTKTLTINRVPVEVKDLWARWLEDHPELRELGHDLTADFDVAPGNRGTEVAIRVITANRNADHTLDDSLRRFKQVVETGEVVRSDGAPEGKRAFGQFPQHPARPLTTEELAEARS
jgi:hypothetical protein